MFLFIIVFINTLNILFYSANINVVIYVKFLGHVCLWNLIVIKQVSGIRFFD